MNISDTPETDDQPIIYAMNDNGYQVLCVDIEFARKLEREREEARDDLRQWQTICLWGGTPEHVHDFIRGQQARIHEAQRIEKTCEQLEREREEARADAAQLADRLSGLELRTTEELARLERELNSARHEAGFWHKLYKKFSIYEEETK